MTIEKKVLYLDRIRNTMPELPDVENFKKYFTKYCLNKKIVDLSSTSKSLIKGISFNNFHGKLLNTEFKSVRRRGKYLLISCRNRRERLVMHFGMTGNLNYRESNGREKYARLIFKFENSHELEWLNKRKLGKIYLVEDVMEIPAIKNMGKEPFDFSEEEFLKLLEKNQGRNIKSFLMDQASIAGIGNIYSDEILFRSSVNPKQKIDNLFPREKRRRLFESMRITLNKATEKTPDAEWGDSWLIFHRKDMRCPKNKNHRLKKEKVAGRSSIYCPLHQKYAG